MSLPRRFLAGLQTAQVWIVLGVLAPLGMLLVSGFMLYDLRRDMWHGPTRRPGACFR